MYGFEKLIIGENETTVTNYRLTIIADTTVRAVFYVIPQAATVLSRIEAAFQNTYEFDNLDVFDGISGKIIQSIIDQNNISYKLTTEFCFTIDSSDTFIFTEIEMLTKEGNIPLLSIYYIDSEIFGGARLYFDMLALENYYYIETATIREIFGTLDAENDTDLGENSEYFSANLLELLGIVYDIENTDKYSSISFNLSAIFELIAELLQSEPNFDFGFLNIIPQLDIVLNVEYKTVLSKECIRDISYTLTCENDENTTLYGNIDKIELESGIQSQASFNPESITKSTVNDIVDMLIWLFEIIRY